MVNKGIALDPNRTHKRLRCMATLGATKTRCRPRLDTDFSVVACLPVESNSVSPGRNGRNEAADVGDAAWAWQGAAGRIMSIF